MMRPLITGILSSLGLLAIYFLIVGVVSGWEFALSQFSQFWYFIVALAVGFGIQVGLYTYLKQAVHHGPSKAVVATSGTTSTVAMVSCCAHYLVNILPILGVTGLVTVISQYQVQLFWVGLLFNAAGVVYLLYKINQFKHTI